MGEDLKELIVGLRSSDAARQYAAAEELARMETESQGAAVPLVEACAVADDETREMVVAALEGLGPPSEADVVALAKLVEHRSGDVAYWAATLLGRLRAHAAPAVGPLASSLAGHTELAVRERSAWALGQIGPEAAAARRALERAAESSTPRLASLAREALTQI